MGSSDSSFGPPSDPTTRLLRRLALVFVVGGLVVFTVPPVVVRVMEDDGGERLGALLALLFWSWLTWQLVVVVRVGHAGAIRRHWRVNAFGWTVLILLYGGFEVADALDGEFDARSLPFTGLVLVFAVASWIEARRQHREVRRTGPASSAV